MVAHLLDQQRDERVDERLLEAEEGVTVTDGTTQDATDDVASLSVGGQLTVGDGEGNGTQVVGTDTHGDVGLAVGTILPARLGGKRLDKRLEDVGVVVGGLALHHHAETLETHAGIDMLGLERLELARCEAVELHEHEVPDFDDERVVLVDQLAARQGGTLGVGTQVDMDLAARAARTLVAHLPEVVLLRAFEYALFGDMLLPVAVSLGVHLEAVFLVAAEDGHIKAVLIDAHHLGEELPTVGDSLTLEVVAEAPVAQHLEHGVVVGVATDLLDVVVLAADTQALLSIADARPLRLRVAEEDVFELVHARIGEHESRVVLYHHRSRRHDMMLFAFEELQKLIAYFLGSHDNF